MRRTPAFGFVACVLALACTRPGQLDYEAEARETPAVAQHAVHSDRVRELMAGLERLERGRLPQAMDVRLELDRRREEIARTARKLALGAAELADLAATLEGLAGDRETFIGFARALERDSAALAEDVPTLPVSAIRERATAIRADCDRCHARFRLGPIETQP